MKTLLAAVLCLCLIEFGTLNAQNSTALRGVYLFGGTDVNLSQMHDSLHLNTVQATTGWIPAQDSTLLNNSNNIKVYT